MLKASFIIYIGVSFSCCYINKQTNFTSVGQKKKRIRIREFIFTFAKHFRSNMKASHLIAADIRLGDKSETELHQYL